MAKTLKNIMGPYAPQEAMPKKWVDEHGDVDVQDPMNEPVKINIKKADDHKKNKLKEDVEIIENAQDDARQERNRRLWDKKMARANKWKEENPQEAAKKAAAKRMAGDLFKKLGKSVKEDVEQVDELSKKTLGSYIKKASDYTTNAERKIGTDAAADYKRSGSTYDLNDKKIKKTLSKVYNRSRNTRKAIDKLTGDKSSGDSKAGRYLHSATFTKDLKASNSGNRTMVGLSNKEDERKIRNRTKGIGRMVDKLTKEDVNESVSHDMYMHYINDAMEHCKELIGYMKTLSDATQKAAEAQENRSSGLVSSSEPYYSGYYSAKEVARQLEDICDSVAQEVDRANRYLQAMKKKK